MKQKVSLAHQREVFRQRLDALPGDGCAGLTQRRMQGGRIENTTLALAFSLLTHPSPLAKNKEPRIYLGL